MEEARQHTPLTAGRWAFATAYVGGLVAILVGLALQVLWQIEAFVPALIIWGATRIILSAWQLLQPGIAIGRNPPRQRLIFTLIAWLLISSLLITVQVAK